MYALNQFEVFWKRAIHVDNLF